jgi:lysophospholipase L1-like esterase
MPIRPCFDHPLNVQVLSSTSAAIALRCVAFLALLWPVSAPLAVAGDPDPARFAAWMAAYAREDARHSRPPGRALFVGSSTIRYWPLAKQMPALAAVNRGLPGAHVSDLVHHVQELVLEHAPGLVVVYVGDNDVADGKGAAQVEGDYVRFTRTVLETLPAVRIVFLSIKPSPARWRRWPLMREVNERIRRQSMGDDRLFFLDLAPAMLGTSGRPRTKLFAADGLHLSEAGYTLWSASLREFLRSLPAASSDTGKAGTAR